MAADVVVKVQGLAELKQELQALPRKLRVRAIRNSLAAGGRVFRDEARRLAPLLNAPVRLKGGAVRRKPGTLRRAMSVRTSKQNRRAGDVGVFVNVRPAKGANRGANNPNDPFYWRFVEFGTTKAGARPYLRPAAANKQAQALRVIEETLGPQVRRLAVKGAQP